MSSCRNFMEDAMNKGFEVVIFFDEEDYFFFNKSLYVSMSILSIIDMAIGYYGSWLEMAFNDSCIELHGRAS